MLGSRAYALVAPLLLTILSAAPIAAEPRLTISYPYSQDGVAPLMPADFDVAFWLDGAVFAEGAVSLRVGGVRVDDWRDPDPIPVRGLPDGVHDVVLGWRVPSGDQVVARRRIRVDDALYRSVDLPGRTDGTWPRPSGVDLGYLPRPTQADIDRAGGRIPPCPAHEARRYHALWDPVRNCYYNHEHKDDPSRLDDVFGPLWSWLPARHGGQLDVRQSISYPWQTWSGFDSGLPPEQGAYENDLKHAGYGWMVRRPADYPGFECYSAFSDYCITHHRYQYHAIGGLPGARGRNHSFWLEARVCSEIDPADCGFIRSGGILDFAELRVDDVPVELPWDPDDVGANGRRLHGGAEPDSHNSYARDFTWYPEHRLVSIAVRGTTWNQIDAEHLTQPWFYCIDPTRCRFPNGDMSESHLTVVNGADLEHLDGSVHDRDGALDGRVSLLGYTDRHGEFVTDGSCDTELLGIDCVPLHVEKLPLAQAQYRDDSHGLGDGIAHYDTSPEGEYWVQFPN